MAPCDKAQHSAIIPTHSVNFFTQFFHFSNFIWLLILCKVYVFVLPEMSFDEELINGHLYTLPVGCKTPWSEKLKNKPKNNNSVFTIILSPKTCNFDYQMLT